MKRFFIRIALISIFLLVFSSCYSPPRLPTELLKKPNLKNAKYLAFPTPCPQHGFHFLHVWYIEKTHKLLGYSKPKKHAHIVYIQIDGCSAGNRIVRFNRKLAKLLLPLYIGSTHKYPLRAGMLIYAGQKK